MEKSRRGRSRQESILTRIVERKGRNGSVKKVKKLFTRVTFMGTRADEHKCSEKCAEDTHYGRIEEWRAADSRTHAKELIKEVLFELNAEGDAALDQVASLEVWQHRNLTQHLVSI